ncbi:hypothetical protein [Desulfonema magnum]|uniref:DUF4198 domain-containing protein n=1 Tax=Desulfonema magnum TaxID=45655 RepID=A0A975BW27_9BACT|nr:hypothetical protein [Desulfonema magnum]QTA92552.1 Uncharacterized protein dnm_086350 [Desulfonema magnum]
MKKLIVYALFCGFFTFIRWLCPQPVAAHGTGCRILSDNKAVTAEFYYSDGEAMSYASILVFGPGDDKTEYQNGRTDRSGRFGFYPDKNGTWRIEANDGMGHKAQAAVEVREEKSAETEAEKNFPSSHAELGNKGTLSTLLKSVLGLSLIFNIFFVIFLWKRKTV